MKHLHLYLLFFYNFSVAQTPLMFEAELYFEDAAGNKDTIIIAYDSTANAYYNPQLGEKNIDSPFNDEFEVRASHSLDWDINANGCILSKKIIGPAKKIIDLTDPHSNCYGGEGVIFFIKTKNQPVTISWDPSIFKKAQNHCHAESFLTPDFNYHLVDPHLWIQWPNKRFACMAKQDKFELNLDRNFTKTNYSSEYTFYTDRQFANGIRDTLYGLEFNFEISAELSPCQLITKTDDKINLIKLPDQHLIYPNPTMDEINLIDIKKKKITSLKLQNLSSGQRFEIKTYEKTNEGIQFSIKDFSEGVYVLQVSHSDGSWTLGKLVKTRN